MSANVTAWLPLIEVSPPAMWNGLARKLLSADRLDSGAVGAEEAGGVSGAGGEGEVVDGGDRAVAFGELSCFDHVWHAGTGRLGGASVTVTGWPAGRVRRLGNAGA